MASTLKQFPVIVLLSLIPGLTPRAADQSEIKYLDLSIAREILKEHGNAVWPELKGIAKEPFKKPERAAKWGLFMAGLITLDRPLTQYYQEQIEPKVKYSLPNVLNSPITQGADGYLLLGVVSQYLAGVVVSSRKAQTTSIMAGKAMAYSYLFAHVVGKSVSGRKRPYPNLSSCNGGDPQKYTCDPLDFGNWHGISFNSDQYGTAMPSFHFTMYFSVARVYARSYDNYWVPYTVMAGLLGSDIEGHHHWVSDMVAGALLGTFIGNRIVDAHEGRKRKRKFMSKWDIYPYAVSSGVGLYLTREI